MADQSQYLAMALQQMQAQPQAVQGAQGLSLEQMQKLAQQRQAWEAANPGQSYMAHGIDQMGANLAAAPQRVASGLQALVQQFGGGSRTPPY